jgi:AraC-like DNA-binding protein
MVSLRCILKVKEELDKLHITYRNVILGEATLNEILTPEKKRLLKKELKNSGLDVIDDKKSVLTERIKTSILEFLDVNLEIKESRFSSYLEKRLKLNYKYLANVFSQIMNVSISHTLLLYKIEKAKELISYNELNMSEIAFRLHFSSLAHFSCTFNKIEGIYPSKFNTNQKRICLEELIDRERVNKINKSPFLREIKIQRKRVLNSRIYPLEILTNLIPLETPLLH